jgi:protein-S-isoprenylcysteine O-methyltransferase Ste14
VFERLRILLSRLVSVLLVAAIALSGSHWNTIVVSSLFLAGTVLVGAASLGRMWCSLYIAGYKNDRLVMDGPYSATRNPLYFFSFLGTIGLGLCTGTLVIPAVMGVLFACYYPFVIATEEKRLAARHGQAYLDYRAAVPAFFPSLARLREPDEYVVQPKVYRRHIFSAIWFVWMLGALVLLHGLRAAGVLPVYITLY